jgi:MFS family permease
MPDNTPSSKRFGLAGVRLPFGIPRDLGILAVWNLTWGLGEGLFIYFYPLALQHWQIDPLQIGAVLSGLGVAMAVVQLPAGYLSDRFGTRPLIRAGSILGVIAAGMMAVANSLPFFIAGLTAYSLGSFVTAPLYSYATHMRGSWSAQRAISFISGSFQVGAILGPMLGGWIAQTAGLSMVFYYAGGLFLIATVMIFFIRRPVVQPDEGEKESSRGNPWTNFRFIGLLVILFFTIIAINTPQQLTAMYLQEVHHLSFQQIGLTGTFAGAGTAVILFVLGGVSPQVGMVTGQVMIGLFAAILWRGQSAAVFYIGYLFIAGHRLYRSMAAAAARPLVKTSDVGLAFGLLETGNALAVILAPLAAGFLYHSQPESVFTVSLAALAVTISLTVLWGLKAGVKSVVRREE